MKKVWIASLLLIAAFATAFALTTSKTMASPAATVSETTSVQALAVAPAPVALALAPAPTLDDPPISTLCNRLGQPPIDWFECPCGEVEGCREGCLELWKQYQEVLCAQTVTCMEPHQKHFHEQKNALQATARECIRNAQTGPQIDACLTTYQTALDALLAEYNAAKAACQAQYDLGIALADMAYDDCKRFCCEQCPPSN